MGRSVPQNVGGFDHLHHEGRKPAAQAVAGPYAGENPVHHAYACRFRRHKATHLGHQHNQSRLPQVGRFTRHVGARNEHQAGGIGRKFHVVGDKVQIRIHRHDNRVETAPNLDTRAGIDLRTHVVVLAGGPSKTVERIHTGDGVGDFLEFATPTVHPVPELTENAVFQLVDVHLGVADDGLALLHLGSDVALGVDGSLLADVFVGNGLGGLGHLGPCNLDVVAEHPVVAHFEARDFQSFPLTAFQGGNPLALILDVGVHGVQFHVGAFPNHSAFANRQGQVVVEILQEFLSPAFGQFQHLTELLEQRGMQFRKHTGNF